MSTINPATDSVLLLHNPNCSKSRATMAVLGQAGIRYQVRLYLEEPLNAAELAELGDKLGLLPREWTRSGQTEYAEAGLDANSDADAVFTAMVAAPILIERPIVVVGKRAKIGRPPIGVLELF